MMNKGVIAIIIAVVAVLGVGGVVALNNRSNNAKTSTTSSTNTGSQDQSSQSQSADGTQPGADPEPTPAVSQGTEVEIADFGFTPATLTVKKGTTVKWTNKDSVAHTVTGDNGGPASELFAKGESYSYTFDTSGTFAYHCVPHPQMVGTVLVVD